MNKNKESLKDKPDIVGCIRVKAKKGCIKDVTTNDGKILARAIGLNVPYTKPIDVCIPSPTEKQLQAKEFEKKINKLSGFEEE